MGTEKVTPQEAEIMTVQELAQYLRLTEATIYKLVKAGEIPAARVGRTWRFRRDLIDELFRQGATDSSDHSK